MNSKETRSVLITVLSAVLLVLALVLRKTGVTNIIIVAVFLAAYIVGGYYVIQSAVKGIRKGNVFNENTLMVVASLGAFIIGEYPEAVFVIVFYRVGEFFENAAVRKSRKSIKDVMEICPDYANLVEDGEVKKVDPDDVETGSLIKILPGEKIPIDGTVVDGSSALNTSALTGESRPRRVSVGSEVLSGCVNGSGVLTIKTTKSFEDSAASKILELVETSYAKKSKSERFITKFAKYYTPAVMAAAVLLAVIPPLVNKGVPFTEYIYRALSFLVVSCPCALVISVPLAFFGGMGAAAKKGILIKGGTYVETLAAVKKAVFDKTGTLTQGSFGVKSVEPADGVNEKLVLQYAAYAESASNHPIAKSIITAYARRINTSIVENASEIPGMGVTCTIKGQTVCAGNGRLMEKFGVKYAAQSGSTVVYVSANGAYLGAIIISDSVKPDAKKLITDLKSRGIKTYMLTGDRAESAKPVAQALGIDSVSSELLPGGKVDELEKIMKSSPNGKTLYVGDGINDAPVLARADVGAAMGALGSDAAVEAADAVIMTDEPGKIIKAIDISKKTMLIAKENIAFSLLVKLAILALCSFGVVGMSVAVFGDVGVMVLAVLNSFRILMTKKEVNA